MTTSKGVASAPHLVCQPLFSSKSKRLPTVLPPWSAALLTAFMPRMANSSGLLLVVAVQVVHSDTPSLLTARTFML